MIWCTDSGHGQVKESTQSQIDPGESHTCSAATRQNVRGQKTLGRIQSILDSEPQPVEEKAIENVHLFFAIFSRLDSVRDEIRESPDVVNGLYTCEVKNADAIGKAAVLSGLRADVRGSDNDPRP